MAVDREKLGEIAYGNPEAKVAVKRKWLAAVLEELKELDRLKAAKERKDTEFVDNTLDKIDGLINKLKGR